MEEIEAMVSQLVQTYEMIEDSQGLMDPLLEVVGNCPKCKKQVIEKTKGYFCESRECDFALWKENRFFQILGKEISKPIAEKLLKTGQVWLGGCRSKKTGKSYDCIVHLKITEDGKTKFEMEFERKLQKEKVAKKKERIR